MDTGRDNIFILLTWPLQRIFESHLVPMWVDTTIPNRDCFVYIVFWIKFTRSSDKNLTLLHRTVTFISFSIDIRSQFLFYPSRWYYVAKMLALFVYYIFFFFCFVSRTTESDSHFRYSFFKSSCIVEFRMKFYFRFSVYSQRSSGAFTKQLKAVFSNKELLTAANCILKTRDKDRSETFVWSYLSIEWKGVI